MRILHLVAIAISLFFIACNRNNNGNNKENKTDTTKFFQINQYLQGEIKEVNATPFFIYRINLIDNKKDSAAIKTAVFNQLSKQFLTPDINNEKLKPDYKESIFEDQTTKSFTISYSTSNKNLELQNVEILLDEDGKTVKRIFLRKFYNYNDSSAIEQLSWKPKERFQIIRSVQKPNNKETSRVTTVVWNKSN